MARMPDGWVVTVEADRKSLEVRITGSRELILCKHCRHFIDNAKHIDLACEFNGTDPNFFCAAGELAEYNEVNNNEK